MKYNFFKTTCLFLFVYLLTSTNNFAQDEGLYSELKNTFQKKYLSLGVLFQTVGDFQIERNLSGHNGFIIKNMRVKIYGELDEGIGYNLQTEFVRSPAVLDAKTYYKFSPAAIVDVGLYKAPFSYEYLTSSNQTDFIYRSQVVNELNVNRQIGIQLRGSLAGNSFKYAAGVFNGNRFSASGNDNNDLLSAARVSYSTDLSVNKSSKIEAGVSAAVSNDKSVSIMGINFTGKRYLFGGDFRLTLNKFLLSGEAIYGKLKHPDNIEQKPLGYHVTIGYSANPKLQFLLRLDSFKPDTNFKRLDKILVGINIFPTMISQFQINYIMPEKENIKHHQLLVKAQVGF
jgi:hypothetical protein